MMGLTPHELEGELVAEGVPPEEARTLSEEYPKGIERLAEERGVDL